MARAGKVRGQTPKVDAQEKKKKRTGMFPPIYLEQSYFSKYLNDE